MPRPSPHTLNGGRDDDNARCVWPRAAAPGGAQNRRSREATEHFADVREGAGKQRYLPVRLRPSPGGRGVRALYVAHEREVRTRLGEPLGRSSDTT